MLSEEEIGRAVSSLGLAGRTICLHSSLRSFGRVDGGAAAVVRGFLSARCTLLAPAFYYRAEVRAPAGREVERNGCDYSAYPLPGAPEVEPYRPVPDCLDRSMGAIPAAMLREPGVVRGDHPVNSFAGLGPEAASLVGLQGPMSVYAPYRELYARGDGWLVLAGVDLTKATPIHFAESCAGRALFRFWAESAGAGVVECEVGGCSEGFNRLAEAVEACECTADVGESRWRLFPFNAFVDVVAAAIRRDSMVTHCGEPGCLRCRDGVLGGPLLS